MVWVWVWGGLTRTNGQWHVVHRGSVAPLPPSPIPSRIAHATQCTGMSPCDRSVHLPLVLVCRLMWCPSDACRAMHASEPAGVASKSLCSRGATPALVPHRPLNRSVPPAPPLLPPL